MNQVISKDGTSIAYNQTGSGPALILIIGALGQRAMHERLAEQLAEHYTVINYDCRGRGGSGDTLPYSVEREIEDIEALIVAAGGSASLYGVSSGAILALEAGHHLAAGIPKMALYEPPLILDDSRPPLPDNYVSQLNEAIATDQPDRALDIFMTQALLVPSEYLAQMKNGPMWRCLRESAHTLAYDGMISGEVMAGKPLKPDKWSHVTASTLVICGGLSEPYFRNSAGTLANHLRKGEVRVLPNQGHDVAPDSLAPILIEFFNPTL